MKFSIKDFFSKCDQIRKGTADLVTFTEEIRNGKHHFLCSGSGWVGKAPTAIKTMASWNFLEDREGHLKPFQNKNLFLISRHFSARWVSIRFLIRKFFILCSEFKWRWPLKLVFYLKKYVMNTRKFIFVIDFLWKEWILKAIFYLQVFT